MKITDLFPGSEVVWTPKFTDIDGNKYIAYQDRLHAIDKQTAIKQGREFADEVTAELSDYFVNTEILYDGEAHPIVLNGDDMTDMAFDLVVDDKPVLGLVGGPRYYKKRIMRGLESGMLYAPILVLGADEFVSTGIDDVYLCEEDAMAGGMFHDFVLLGKATFTGRVHAFEELNDGDQSLVLRAPSQRISIALIGGPLFELSKQWDDGMDIDPNDLEELLGLFADLFSGGEDE